MSTSPLRIFNLFAYQIAWFACVLGAARDLAWAGAALALVATAVHLALHRDWRELRLILCASAIGFLVDTILARTDVVVFESTAWSGFAPLWMVSLWMVFATTLNHSLSWLSSRPLLAALAGAIGGPLAYLAGAKLGALSIVMSAPALSLTASLWAVAVALLALLTTRSESADQRVPA